MPDHWSQAFLKAVSDVRQAFGQLDEAIREDKLEELYGKWKQVDLLLSVPCLMDDHPDEITALLAASAVLAPSFASVSGAPSALRQGCIKIAGGDFVTSCDSIVKEVAELLAFVPEETKQTYCKKLNEVAERTDSVRITGSLKEDSIWLKELQKGMDALLPGIGALPIAGESKILVCSKINRLIADFKTFRRFPDEPPPVSAVVSSEPPGDAQCDALGRYTHAAHRIFEILRMFPELDSKILEVVKDSNQLAAILRYAVGLPVPYSGQGERQGIDKAKSVIPADFFGILRNSQSNFRYMYVRKCYVQFRQRLMRMVKDMHAPPQYRFHCLLSGNPGIGKSAFLIYHIIQLLREFFHSGLTGPESSIFLATGRMFYVYSVRSGWLRISMEGFETLGASDDCENSWVLSDSYDIGFGPRGKTLLVASPYRRYYREYKKFDPSACFLPTWSWNEVLAFHTYLEGLGNGVSLKIIQDTARPAKKALDNSDEIARNFVDNPNGMPLFLTKDRLWDRFFHRGGVVRLLFQLVLLEPMKAVSAGKINAELWAKIQDGTVCMENRNTSELGFQAPAEIIEHEVLEFSVTECYSATDGVFKPISPYAMKLMSDGCALFTLDELISTISSKDCDQTQCFYFESLCLKYLSYQPIVDHQPTRAAYLRKMWSKQDQNMILEIPKVGTRSFADLSHLVDIGATSGGLVFAQPVSHQLKAFDAFYLPGIALQFTISAERKWSSKPVLLECLCELLEQDVWGFPPNGAMYKLCYVVPDKVFSTFKPKGLAKRPTSTCSCAYRNAVCTDCCFKYFEPYVIGIPNLTTPPIPSTKFGPFPERVTLDGNGRFVRLGHVEPAFDIVGAVSVANDQDAMRVASATVSTPACSGSGSGRPRVDEVSVAIAQDAMILASATVSVPSSSGSGSSRPRLDEVSVAIAQDAMILAPATVSDPSSSSSCVIPRSGLTLAATTDRKRPASDLVEADAPPLKLAAPEERLE